ncbi:MAG: PHP domain-containing protein [Candidatus Omnitrophota bacterium]
MMFLKKNNKPSNNFQNSGNDFVDLHIHTNYSDGILSPQEVVEKAIKIGLRAISITDHDCVGGISSAIEAAKGTLLEIIPGVEISSVKEETEIHLLGYFIDHKDPDLLKMLEDLRKGRIERMKRIISLLNEHNVPIRDEDVFGTKLTGTVGRLYLARLMVEKKNGSGHERGF